MANKRWDKWESWCWSCFVLSLILLMLILSRKQVQMHRDRFLVMSRGSSACIVSSKSQWLHSKCFLGLSNGYLLCDVLPRVVLFQANQESQWLHRNAKWFDAWCRRCLPEITGTENHAVLCNHPGSRYFSKQCTAHFHPDIIWSQVCQKMCYYLLK